MRRLIIATLVTLLAVPAVAADGPQTEDQKILYSIGMYQGRQLSRFNFTPEEFKMVLQGFADSAPGKQPKIDFELYGKKVQELAQKRRAATGAGTASTGKDVLEKGAIKSKSGLIFQSIREGSGASPRPTDMVEVHYRGMLENGKEFDNSHKRKTPAYARLDSFIPCWTEGLQKMKEGGRAKLVCPPELAYGVQGDGSLIPPNAVLIFDIELLKVEKGN